MFLKNRWGFSNEDNKSVAEAENEKSPGFSYAENWLTDWLLPFQDEALLALSIHLLNFVIDYLF